MDFCSEKLLRVKATFCGCNCETSFAAIVCAFYQTFANQISHGVLDFPFVGKVNYWRRTKFQTMTNFEITRAAKAVARRLDFGCSTMLSLFSAVRRACGNCGDFADQNDPVPFVLEPLSRDMLFPVNQSDHADGRRWIDHTGRALIVQRNISAGDGCAKR